MTEHLTFQSVATPRIDRLIEHQVQKIDYCLNQPLKPQDPPPPPAPQV